MERREPPPAETDALGAALARIGESADGKLLARYLRLHYLEAVPPVGCPVGALRDYEAARRIAAPLVKSLERKANVANGKRNDPAAGG